MAQCKGANDQTGQRDTIGMLFFLSLVGSAVVAILGLAIYEAPLSGVKCTGECLSGCLRLHEDHLLWNGVRFWL